MRFKVDLMLFPRLIQPKRAVIKFEPIIVGAEAVDLYSSEAGGAMRGVMYFRDLIGTKKSKPFDLDFWQGQ